MDAKALQALTAKISGYGNEKGVFAELHLVDMQKSDVNPGGRRLQLRVFRMMTGKQPLEYSEGMGYAIETPDLEKRIERDIDTAARKLYEC